MSQYKPRHDLAKVIQSGLYKNYPDEDLVAEINCIYAGNNYGISYSTTSPVMDLFATELDQSEESWMVRRQLIMDFNSYCIHSDLRGYVKYLFSVFLETTRWTLCWIGQRRWIGRFESLRWLLDVEKPFLDVFGFVTIGHAYFVSGVLLIIAVVEWIRKKQCPYILLGLSGGALSFLLSVTLGTYSEWYRTMLCVVPFTYTGGGVLTGMFISTFTKEGEAGSGQNTRVRLEGREFGFDLLRIFMCFCVVCCHLWAPAASSIASTLIFCAVPVFVCLSFFLTAEMIVNCDWKRIGARMVRIAKPYFLWPLICFSMVNVVDYAAKGRWTYGLKDILLQYVGDSRIRECLTLYYLFDLAVITIFLALVFRVFREKGYNVSCWIAILCNIWVYSNLNYALFGRLSADVKTELGRLAELMPYAVIGLLLSRMDLESIRSKWDKAAVSWGCRIGGTALLMVLWVNKDYRATSAWGSFQYGFPHQIVISVGLLLLFYFLPRPKWLQGKFKRGVTEIAKLSGRSIPQKWNGLFCRRFGCLLSHWYFAGSFPSCRGRYVGISYVRFAES